MSASAPLRETEPRMPVPDDGVVVARILQGDREAFRLLVQRHQEPAYRLALGMVGSGDVAADLVQDSFVKAYTRLDRCRNPAQFGAWMRRIVRNRCLDYLKDRRRAVVPIHAAFEVEAADEPMDRSLEREETRAVVLDALKILPEDQREAFILKHVEELSYEEMAEIVGASVSALKMRVKRARETLQRALAGRTL